MTYDFNALGLSEKMALLHVNDYRTPEVTPLEPPLFQVHASSSLVNFENDLSGPDK